MRKKNWLVKGVKVAGFGVLGIAVAGEVVAQLWNHLMPELFGAHTIGFWQALGLLVLSRIFFGGFPGKAGIWSTLEAADGGALGSDES